MTIESPHDSVESPARFRERRLKWAVASSLGSKATTAIVQIAAFPLAVRALGERQFVLYAMLASAVGWLGLVNIGVGPPLTVRVSQAAAAGDLAAEGRLFSSAMIPVALLVAATGALLATALWVFPVPALFGPRYAAESATITAGLGILLIVFLAQTLLSVVEAAQLGYQEQYKFNAMAIGGNLASAVAIIYVATVVPTVTGMIAAVSLPPVAFRLANAVGVLRGRPHLRPTRHGFSMDECRALVSSGVAFSVAGGLGNFLCHQYPTVLLGSWLPVSDAAAFAVTMNALLVAAGMVSMVTVSLWPAISDGLARGEHAWIKRAYHRIVGYSVGYGLLVAGVFALGGPVLFRLWFGPSVNVGTGLSVALAVYFLLLMWENAHFAVLIGMKRIAVPSLLFLCRSVVAVAAMSTLVAWIGPPGAFVALAASVCLFTLLPFRTMVRRRLSQI